MRARMTGMSRRRSPCATASSIVGWNPPARPISAATSALYYLSLEFLVGRSFRDCMTNLELTEAMAGALDDLGVDIETVAGA